MIIQALENYARCFGPWMSAYQRATADFTRINNHQTELAIETGRFLTDRLWAYSECDGNVESLARRLDDLTNRYTAVYAERVKEMNSSWAHTLREDSSFDELTGAIPPPSKEAPSAQKRRSPQEKPEAPLTAGARQ